MRLQTADCFVIDPCECIRQNSVMRDGFFTEEFLQNLPSDILEASEQLCEEFCRLIDTKRAAYEELVEAYAILQAFSNSRQRREPFPQLGTNQQENKEKIIEAFGKIRSFAAANLTKRRSQGMLA